MFSTLASWGRDTSLLPSALPLAHTHVCSGIREAEPWRSFDAVFIPQVLEKVVAAVEGGLTEVARKDAGLVTYPEVAPQAVHVLEAYAALGAMRRCQHGCSELSPCCVVMSSSSSSSDLAHGHLVPHPCVRKSPCSQHTLRLPVRALRLIQSFASSRVSRLGDWGCLSWELQPRSSCTPRTKTISHVYRLQLLTRCEWLSWT